MALFEVRYIFVIVIYGEVECFQTTARVVCVCVISRMLEKNDPSLPPRSRILIVLICIKTNIKWLRGTKLFLDHL